MLHLPLLLTSLLFAPVQAAAAPPSTPASFQNPIDLHLMTLIDHADTLGGQRVRVHVARVKRVIGPRLIVVNEPRVRGIDATYETFFWLDRLLVLLPPSVTVAPGQLIGVTGVVRTVASGRALGLPLDVSRRGSKAWSRDAKHMAKTGNQPLLVADSVAAPDGAILAETPGVGR